MKKYLTGYFSTRTGLDRKLRRSETSIGEGAIESMSDVRSIQATTHFICVRVLPKIQEKTARPKAGRSESLAVPLVLLLLILEDEAVSQICHLGKQKQIIPSKTVSELPVPTIVFVETADGVYALAPEA